jgi:light-regulated signal transduction histidine kinase (bacteriophytochrome)
MNELVRVREDFDEFVYAASHDLAEPLTVVAGYVRLLGKRYGEQLDADGRQFVETILDSVARAEHMIEDLRSFSRVATRAGSLESVDSGRAAAEAVGLLGSVVEKNDARVDIGSLPTVRADEAQLVRLFSTLLSNALTFRSEEAPRIGIEAERDGLHWDFAVRDNGVGVAERDRERIFHIFQHGDTGARSGTGAGLAIARRIVERQGGAIWVEDAPEGGSVFHFTLPENGEDSR